VSVCLSVCLTATEEEKTEEEEEEEEKATSSMSVSGNIATAKCSTYED
jgi:hypothetical protein